MYETPPPFTPGQAAPQKGVPVWVWVVLVVLLMCTLTGVASVMFFRATWNQVSGIASCAITSEAARDGILAYAKNNNDTLPNAATWQNDIASYYEEKRATRIKELESGPGFVKDMIPPAATEAFICASGQPITAFFFNADLSGKKLADIKDKTTTVLLFEKAVTAPNPGLNLSDKFVKQDPKTAPKMMGQTREWITVPVEGESSFGSSSSTSGVRVNTNAP